MKHSFTQNDLVSYIYNEKSASESIAIQEALKSDWDLKSAYVELIEGFNQLPKVTFRPSLSSVKRLLRYSANKMVEVSC